MFIPGNFVDECSICQRRDHFLPDNHRRTANRMQITTETATTSRVNFPQSIPKTAHISFTSADFLTSFFRKRRT